MNKRLLYRGIVFTLFTWTATLPEVFTYGSSVVGGNLSYRNLIASCSSPCPQGTEFHTIELPDSLIFRSSKQILSRDFTGCEVLTGFTTTTLTSAPGLYPMQAGVNKLPIS